MSLPNESKQPSTLSESGGMKRSNFCSVHIPATVPPLPRHWLHHTLSLCLSLPLFCRPSFLRGGRRPAEKSSRDRSRLIPSERAIFTDFSYEAVHRYGTEVKVDRITFALSFYTICKMSMAGAFTSVRVVFSRRIANFVQYRVLVTYRLQTVQFYEAAGERSQLDDIFCFTSLAPHSLIVIRPKSSYRGIGRGCCSVA